MRKFYIFAIILLLLTSIVFSQSEATPKKTEKASFDYVGAKKCKICHKKDGIYESWSASKHATAYESLTAEQKKDKSLLKYYSTGTTKKGDLLTGVQCEACHGAGSGFKKKSIMKDREKAIAKGLIIPDEKTCLGCHNEKAPAALAKTAKGFDFDKMKAKGVHSMIPDSMRIKKTK